MYKKYFFWGHVFFAVTTAGVLVMQGCGKKKTEPLGAKVIVSETTLLEFDNGSPSICTVAVNGGERLEIEPWHIVSIPIKPGRHHVSALKENGDVNEWSVVIPSKKVATIFLEPKEKVTSVLAEYRDDGKLNPFYLPEKAIVTDRPAISDLGLLGKLKIQYDVETNSKIKPFSLVKLYKIPDGMLSVEEAQSVLGSCRNAYSGYLNKRSSALLENAVKCIHECADTDKIFDVIFSFLDDLPEDPWITSSLVIQAMLQLEARNSDDEALLLEWLRNPISATSGIKAARATGAARVLLSGSNQPLVKNIFPSLSLNNRICIVRSLRLLTKSSVARDILLQSLVSGEKSFAEEIAVLISMVEFRVDGIFSRHMRAYINLFVENDQENIKKRGALERGWMHQLSSGDYVSYGDWADNELIRLASNSDGGVCLGAIRLLIARDASERLAVIFSDLSDEAKLYAIELQHSEFKKTKKLSAEKISLVSKGLFEDAPSTRLAAFEVLSEMSRLSGSEDILNLLRKAAESETDKQTKEFMSVYLLAAQSKTKQ